MLWWKQFQYNIYKITKPNDPENINNIVIECLFDTYSLYKIEM